MTADDRQIEGFSAHNFETYSVVGWDPLEHFQDLRLVNNEVNVSTLSVDANVVIE